MRGPEAANVRQQRYNPDIGDGSRFRDLVLYISKQYEKDPTFGAIKLNKVLYYADFYAYRVLGHSITGATYQKLPEGPAPRQLLEQRRILVDGGHARLVARPYFNGVQHRLFVVPGHEVDPKNVFADQELTIIDEVIDFFRGKTAREVSDYSHRERGWVLVDYGEDIPYETAWLSTDPMEEDEYQTGVMLAAQRGYQ